MIIIVSSVPEATLKELHGHDCVRHENVIICDDSVKEKLELLQSIQYMCEVISEDVLDLDMFPDLEPGSITIEFTGVPKEVRSEMHPHLAGMAKRKIDYKNPDIVLRVVRADKDYLTRQLHAHDLSKRSYRIFAHKQGFRGDFAFMIVQKCDPNLEGLQIYGVKDGALLFEQIRRFKEFPMQQVYEPEQNTIRSLDRHLRLEGVRDMVTVHGGDWKNLHEKLVPSQNNLVFLTRSDESKLNVIFNYFMTANQGSKLHILSRSQCHLHPHPAFEVTVSTQVSRGQHVYNFYTFIKS